MRGVLVTSFEGIVVTWESEFEPLPNSLCDTFKFDVSGYKTIPLEVLGPFK